MSKKRRKKTGEYLPGKNYRFGINNIPGSVLGKLAEMADADRRSLNDFLIIKLEEITK